MNNYKNSLELLSDSLRKARIANGDKQSDAAARIGIGISTYAKMENANPGVAIGHWIKALHYMGNPTLLIQALTEQDELFSMLDDTKKGSNKQRVRGKI